MKDKIEELKYELEIGEVAIESLRLTLFDSPITMIINPVLFIALSTAIYAGNKLVSYHDRGTDN